MDFKELFSPENITTVATNLAIIIAALATGYQVFSKKLTELTEKSGSSIKEEIKKQSDSDLKIIRKLEEVKEMLNADRVQIYDFHNGIHYANGRSAIKITCTYESCRCGVKSYQNQLSGLPISCLPNFIATLLNEGEFLCKDIETIKDTNPATYAFKKNMEIKSFYDVVFHNEEGDIVGFIAIQFCNNKYNVDKDIVQKLVGYVEAELSSLIKQSNKQINSKKKRIK